MRFHAYNGLGPQCNMSGFSLQYDDLNVPLNFPSDGSLIPEDQIDFVPQNVEFTVKVPSDPVDCGDMKIDFSDFIFTGPPREHVVSSNTLEYIRMNSWT